MKRLAAVTLALALAGCASASAFRAGEKAERLQDYDRAVIEYSRALQLDPDNLRAKQSLERARLRASSAHADAARRLANRLAYKEALEEYRLAIDLSPATTDLVEEAVAVEKRLRDGTPPPSLDSLKQQARERPLAGLEPGPAASVPLSLTFKSASLREVYLAVGKAAGVNFVFDPDFRDQAVSLELDAVPFEQALAAVAAAGRTFHRVMDTKLVSVVPDTAAKRREYEQQVVKTLFLSNADLKEAIDLLRIVLGARRVAPLPGGNALTINDTPEKVAAAERIVAMIDKRRAEVMIEVEILEVNRNLLREYGIEITSGIPGVDGVITAIGPNPDETFTLADNPYSKENLVVVGLPGVVARLLENDKSTRVLANPQLRTSEGERAEARFGDQVPVPVTIFSPIATGGVSQQPITSFEYKNVGVNIDITPRVHHDGDISLALKLDISAVGPPGFNSLPTFNSRSIETVLRLKDGETNLLAGLISRQEREALRGVPGLASIPFLGKLFSNNSSELVETDIVMTLTPRVIARPELSIEDLRSFALGAEASPTLFEVPPGPLPAGTPMPSPARIEPIRPPAPAGPAPTPTPQ